MKYKTCVSIAEKTPYKIKQKLKIALKKSDYAEIRFDFLKRKLTPILKEWGIGEDQWTFLIDSNGLVVAKFENFVSEKEIAHYIDQLIN